MQQEVTQHAAKAAPPVAVSGLSFLHVPLSEWVYILTAVYLVFQIAVILPRVYRGICELKEKVLDE